MWSSHHSAFGLDISDLSIKLAWLKKTGRQFRLASFSRQEIPEGAIEEGEIKKEEELIEIIKKTITDVKGEKVKTKYCVVSLPETEAFIRVIQLPKINEDEIGEAIKWELESNFPVTLEEVYFDWQVIKNSFSPESLNILIGALPKKLVDPYLSVIKKAGLRPVVFEIESIATARALIKEDKPEEPLMIIDFGAKRSSFIIFASGAIWLTTSLPIANNLLVADIARMLKIDAAKAKKLKIEFGLNLFEEGGKIFQAMEPRLMELAQEIRKYLEYYQTNLLPKLPQKAPINKILLCGGGASLEGLSGFLSSELKMEVTVGNPWINIFDPSSAPKKLPGLPFSESLSYTTALGLALRGAKQ